MRNLKYFVIKLYKRCYGIYLFQALLGHFNSVVEPELFD
jgi:hypothetical protein